MQNHAASRDKHEDELHKQFVPFEISDARIRRTL